MPVPQQLGRGDRMGRGPYEKSGMLEDTGLPPLRTVTQSYDIFFPVKEQENEEGEMVRSFPVDKLQIEVKLWYLPYGTMEDDAFLWRDVKRIVKVSTEDK
jgi:hypothetical protein